MYKYRYFPILFGGLILLLISLFFPVSFDNNDDQMMYFISAGVLSDIPSASLLLSSLLTGKVLNALFRFSDSVNWYTLLLQLVQLSSLVCLLFVFIQSKRVTCLHTVLLTIIVVFGYGALSTVKLQFTTVALFCSFAALFMMESEQLNKNRIALSCILIAVAILIRKDVFYVFILFSIPVLFRNYLDKKKLRKLSVVPIFAVLVFLSSAIVEVATQTTASVNSLKAMDNIAAKPVHITTDLLNEYSFTQDDIALVSGWFLADNGLQQSEQLVRFSRKISSYRNPNEFLKELKWFVTEERYALSMYVFTILLLLFAAKKNRYITLLNFFLVLFFFAALMLFSRLPHRLTFPVLGYLTLLNLFYMLKNSEPNRHLKTGLLFLVIMSMYKMYCVVKIIPVHKEYHTTFERYHIELSAHPDKLFIALTNGFPVQYMNAWSPPDKLFPSKNIIFTGWYMSSSDYKNVLQKHHLLNLTSDLRYRDDIYFLSPTTEFQLAYLNVLKKRFGLTARFEEASEGFNYIKPQRLIFQN